MPGTQLTVTAPRPGGDAHRARGRVGGPVARGGAAAAGAPVDEKVTLTVPEGAVPGTQLTVTAPSGQQVTLTVPEGVEAGQQLEVVVPAAGGGLGNEMIVMAVPEARCRARLTVTAPTGQQVTLTVPEGVEARANSSRWSCRRSRALRRRR